MLFEPEAISAVLPVLTVLDSLDVPYVIGGSFASVAHGMPRATMDIDIVADLHLDQVDFFVSALQGQYYVDRQAVVTAIAQTTGFNLLSLPTMFKVDVFIAKNRAFDRQQLTRRVSKIVTQTAEQTAWFASPEDTILAKLEWFRLGGEVSERQWRDVLGVIKTQGDQLDHAYLHQWAATLKVADLLEVALNNA